MKRRALAWLGREAVRLVVTLGIGLGVVYAARAAPNAGHSMKTFAFAGTLAGVKGATLLTFHFTKSGKPVTCSNPAATASTTPDDAGAFVAMVDISGCPSDLFDGSDLEVSVDVGGTKDVVKDQLVGAVPYAKYAEQVGSPDCPSGYARDAGEKAFVVCKKANDEVVRVGTRASAFWIDRYEASVWSEIDGLGTQYGANTDDYLATFPDNGQYTAPLHAASVAGVLPSSNLTWFQAAAACRAAGKRLPNGEEWLAAARGTITPTPPSSGAGGACRTQAASARTTGGGSGCRSAWGAEDMIGNLLEVTADWHAGVGDDSITPQATPWPDTSYTGDVFNVASKANNGQTDAVQGNPSVAFRGGSHLNAASAGLLTLNLSYGPTEHDTSQGFRCVIPR